jgi:hypothetical protein
MARDTGERHKVVQDTRRLARHSDAVIVLPCCRMAQSVIDFCNVQTTNFAHLIIESTRSSAVDIKTPKNAITDWLSLK